MKLAKHDLVAALRLRYDHYSAQTIFDGALGRAGLADQDAYDRSEIAAFRAALAKVGDRLTAVDARLDHLLDLAGPAPEPGEPKPASADPKAAPGEPKPAGPKVPPAEARVAAAAESKAAAGEPKPAAAGPKVPGDPKAAAAGPKLPGDPRAADPKTAPGPKPGSTDPKAARASETTIVLTGVELDDGDRVMVCGDQPELGNWEPERARPMTRDGARWRTTLQVPPDAPGSFKFFRRTADGDVIWEAGDNRELEAVPQIDAVWQ